MTSKLAGIIMISIWIDLNYFWGHLRSKVNLGLDFWNVLIQGSYLIGMILRTILNTKHTSEVILGQMLNWGQIFSIFWWDSKLISIIIDSLNRFVCLPYFGGQMFLFTVNLNFIRDLKHQNKLSLLWLRFCYRDQNIWPSNYIEIVIGHIFSFSP